MCDWCPSRDGSVSVLSDCAGIKVASLENTTGVDCRIQPSHIIHLVRSDIRGDMFAGDYGRICNVVCSPGIATFVPCGVDVSTEAIEPYSVDAVCLEQSIFDEVSAITGSKVELRTMTPRESSVSGIAESIVKMASSGALSSDFLLTDSIKMALSLSILREITTVVFGGESLAGHRLRRVAEFVRSNIGGQISLSDMAGAASMSKFHFSRAFKKETGVTPLQYVTRMRVQRAKAMLSGGGLSLSCIDAACGFASQSHMASVFKSVVGVSPGAYRRMW